MTMDPIEFNKVMLEFFEKIGGEGMEVLHEIFRAKATAILYQAMMSGDPLIMSEVPLNTGTVHRAKNVLIKHHLIKRDGTFRVEKHGPISELWVLNR